MKTLDFSSVIYGAATLAGQDRENLPSFFFRQVRDLVDISLHEAWDQADWPELIRVSSQTVTDSGDLEYLTYPADASQIINVWKHHPRERSSNAAINYTLYNDGGNSNPEKIAIFDTSVTGTVYIEYRKARPSLTGDVWSSTTNYAAGDQVYFEDSNNVGNFYEAGSSANDPTAGQSPSSHAAKWTKVELPKIFQPFLIQIAFAGHLKANGQLDAGTVEEIKAREFLAKEVEQLTSIQRQQSSINVMTY